VAAAGLVTSHHLRDFMEAGTPPVYEGELPAGAVVANARCAIGASTSLHEAAAGQAWKVNGRVAALCLARPCMPDELPGAFAAASAADAAAGAAGGAAADAAGDDAKRLVGAEPLAGRWLDAVWELVSSLPELLLDDLLTLAMERHETLVRPTDANIIGDHPVLAAWDVRIEPHVVIDARSGPVILDRKSVV